jgi:hypothetical protein
MDIASSKEKGTKESLALERTRIFFRHGKDQTGLRCLLDNIEAIGGAL